MHPLPEPKPTAPAAGQAHDSNSLTESVIQAAVRDLVQQTRYDNPDLPSHKDGPRIGDTPPVQQPDSRIAPQWAVGIAVASIGVGAGSVALGCASWLFFKGLSMVSVPSLERFAWIIIAPFAGLAMAATAIGGLISKAKKAAMPDIHNHTYTGDVHQETHVDQRKSIWNTEKTIVKK
jgi:hypothetical protein